MSLNSTIFHEPWWLTAVTGGHYDEVTVSQSGALVGRLPFISARRGPFHVSILPAFTHLLGPVVDAGEGKPQSRLIRRLSTVRDLIDQLPRFSFFKQAFDPSVGEGLAIADGLAFQERGYRVRPQYNFYIPASTALDDVWRNLHTTVRQHIRRAEKKLRVTEIDDPDRFISFYLENIGKQRKVNRTNFTNFKPLFEATRKRSCGEILCVEDSHGKPAAMTFLVWGHGVMYYLLSSRAPDTADSGAVNLLLWSAITRAKSRDMKFDFDGVYSSGSARFLSGFGGQLQIRLIASRADVVYGSIQYMRARLRVGETEFS